VVIKTSDRPMQQVGDVVFTRNVSIKVPNKDSFKSYAIKEQLLGTARQKQFKAPVIYHPTYSVSRFIQTKRENLARTLQQKMSAGCFKYFSYLFLGNKKITRHNELIREYCKYWGISHYLARSGLHLVLFAIATDLLFRFLPLPFIVKELTLLCIFIIYALLSWSSISFLRSLLMLCSYKIARLCIQQTNVLHILCLTTWYVLLVNPIQLFFLDFQLSFGITFLLALHTQIAHQKKQTIEKQSKS
jgi:ComEC/Rec2-related protein